MTVTERVAMKLWSDVFGENTLLAQDCFGTWMHRDDYGNTKKMRVSSHDGRRYLYGWAVDHIMPISKGGKDVWNNFEPMHFINNNAKEDLISFKIRDVSYQVIKCELSPGYGYGIKKQQTGERVDWKGTQKRWYL